MSITYEEALATLTSMFGPPWTQETLDAVLRHHEGHMENTVETVLAHGDGDPAELVERLKNPPSSPNDGAGGGDGGSSEHVNLDEELARQLAAEDQRGTAPAARPRQPVRPTGLDGTPLPGPAGRPSAVPAGDASEQPTEGGEAPAPAPAPAGKKQRGTPTQLPPDFLRVPGRSADIDADEQLARMLQDELFTRELANNPEFAHLAGRGRGRGRGRGSAVPAGAGGGGWFGSRLASERSVGPTGLGGHPLPGFPGRAASGRAGGQQHEGPNIMENLKEMGDAAKRRLALFAQQFNERVNNPQGAHAAAGPGDSTGGMGGSSGAAERRGLLDGDGDAEEEVSFLRRSNPDLETTSPGGKKND